MSRMENIVEMYADVPRSVVLKYELSRIGIAMSQAALDVSQAIDTCFKGDFMFSWDTGERKTTVQKVPWYFYFKRDDTFMINRTNDGSPYVIDYIDRRFVICEDGEEIEEIYFLPAPEYYSVKTSDGVPMSTVVQKLGDMLFITVNKYCEFWKDETECKFCDIMSVTREQAKTGELGATHRTAEQVAEVLRLAVDDPLPIPSRHCIVSGGSIVTKYQGKSEIEYYCGHLEAVFNKLGRVFPTAIQIVPPDKEGWKRLRDIGIVSVQPNMEVWDREKFKAICPGKEKYVGYDEYIKRILVGAEIFGPGRINPNFVAGVEMAKPWGFDDPEEAAESTLSGFEFLMQNGVFPRTATWLVEKGSALAGQEPPPLEYYIKLGKGYKELRQRYGFVDNLPCLCRACNSQDPLHDWDYAEGKEKETNRS